jgi:hypothetical protein
MALTLVLAALLQALAASALLTPGPAAPPAACRAALAAGDQVRERFLEHACADAFGAGRAEIKRCCSGVAEPPVLKGGL